LKRGLPRALLTDNGPAMLAAETREGLERLGIVHERTLAYAAYQKGFASHCTSSVGLSGGC
jgi:transposase InsO family protein